MKENYVTFTLKNPQKDVKESNQKNTLVYLNFSYGYYTVNSKTKARKYKPLKYSTGIKVKPHQFHGKPTYRVKQNARTDVIGKNNELQKISNTIIDVYEELSKGGRMPTPDDLRNELDFKFGRKQNVQSNLSNGFLDSYFKIYEKGISSGEILTKDGQKFAQRSVNDFGYFLKLWDLFEEKQKWKYRFDDIDFKFYDDFVNFLTLPHIVGKEKLKKEFMNMTINRMLRWFNTIMNKTRKLGYHDNDIVSHPEWKLLPKSTKKKIALNSAELKMLEELDLSGNQYLDSIRDTLLVGTYIAQRYQDYSMLQDVNLIEIEKENGENEVFLQIIQKKGAHNNKVIIPLWTPLKRILEKWNYSLPKIGRKQYGKYIKELGKLAGINTIEKYEYVKGGRKIIETKPRFDLIVPHTPRRTGISVMRITIPDSQVKKISGHLTDVAYQDYVKTTSEEIALQLSNHNPF